jgi:diguanylate cyclase (GGDEF)-like protein
MRDVNPLTHLVGNVQIQGEIERRLESSSGFALMYVDVDNFKAFNDHYGSLRGDGAIKLLGSTIGLSVTRHGGEDSFVGHIGGDDFVAITHPDAALATAKDICDAWDRQLVGLYDVEDLERGYVEAQDRRKQVHRYPLATISIGIATNLHRPIKSHWEAFEIAIEMKSFAKRIPGSSFAIDRRGPDGDATKFDTSASIDSARGA